MEIAYCHYLHVVIVYSNKANALNDILYCNKANFISDTLRVVCFNTNTCLVVIYVNTLINKYYIFQASSWETRHR